MKKSVIAVVLTCCIALAGCSSTKSIITEYDASGNVIKVTESSQSIVKEITESTKGKTVVAWESGWAAYISGSTATQEDPTPHIKLFAGKTDRGLISAMPNQTNWSGIAEVVNATKYELSVTTSGVVSSGNSSEKQNE